MINFLTKMELTAQDVKCYGFGQRRDARVSYGKTSESYDRALKSKHNWKSTKSEQDKCIGKSHNNSHPAPHVTTAQFHSCCERNSLV